MQRAIKRGLASCVGFVALAAIASSIPATASTIPYPNKGTVAPTPSLIASLTGDLVAYFLNSKAVFDNTLGLEVNGVERASGVFDNHTTAQGTAFDFGSVKAGDVLTFFITSTYRGHSNTFYSDPTRNSDKINHAYSTAYDGSVTGIPTGGTYVGFEDLRGGGDLNYRDEAFVYDVNPMAVPLPASAPMFGAALIALGIAGYGIGRRKTAAA